MVTPLRTEAGYVSRSLSEFLAHPYPPADPILTPWLETGGLVMLAGYRGVGKTILSLASALAIATGTEVLGFKAPKARSVLYVDAEMNPAQVQERLKALCMGHKGPGLSLAPSNFRIASHVDQKGSFINLFEEEGQHRMEDTLGDSEVLILDNRLTLYRSGDYYSPEGNEVLQDWLVRLRSSNRAVILVHHTGKPKGEERDQFSQLGSVTNETVLDATLLMMPLPRRQKGFSLVADKARNFEAWEPMACRICWENARCWLEEIEEGAGAEGQTEKIMKMHDEGAPAGEIAKKVGLSMSTVSRIVKGAV